MIRPCALPPEPWPFLPPGRVPQVNVRVPCRGESLAVRAEGDGQRADLIARDLPKLLAGGNLPEPEARTPRIARDHRPAIRRECKGSVSIARRLDPAQLFPRCRVQETDRLVIVAGRQELPVGCIDQRTVRSPAAPPAH